MRVTITGATGTIGRALVGELTARGDEVTALSRNPATANLDAETREWRDPKAERPPAEALRGRDAVVHLLGETMAQRWTDDAKREIRDSRVLSTRNLVAALAELSEGERPDTLVSQSAVGWYGPRGDERLDEDQPAGNDFQAAVVRDWEAEAQKAEGVRVVLTRTGVVLSPQGGALEKMLPFFKLGIGGPVAGGRQYVPWVHLDDVVGAILFLIGEQLSGPVNVTAPEPVTNKELSRTLGRVLRRPAIAPVPALAVKTLYGEMATIVTTGQRAVPARLMEHGYDFRRPDLEDALRSAT
ncbi:MAG TPA: TIGR01777 family oxidoreductase [Thermoleophilaceae bacterium]|nr:TIGR01777 family oxidoreductase [Thermoleophilaceae bacterium]